jgi:hypothetical protein
MRFCPAGGERPLTGREIALARSIFGEEVDYGKVSIRRRKWFPLQPREVAMAPCGHIHFHPGGNLYCEDFGDAALELQGLFIHEMTHVWQAQAKGNWFLLLRRHPFCRYGYTLSPGKHLIRYGIEQQAEIVRHAFILRNGGKIAGVGDARAYERLVSFKGAGKIA